MQFVRNNSTDPYYNMSFDEWCLEHPVSDDIFFYLWSNRPSVIMGVTQDQSAEVNLKYLEDHDILLVRRSTGGGAVYHDLNNLNYSFVGPVDKMDSSIVQGVADALRHFGVDAVVSGRNDIFVGPCKVSGYAKRVTADRALIHGTLMYDVDIDVLTNALDTPLSKLHRKGVASVRSRVTNLKDLLPQFKTLDEFQTALQEYFAAGDGEMKLPASASADIMREVENKYRTREWIFKY